jgi:hypothetical protein
MHVQEPGYRALSQFCLLGRAPGLALSSSCALWLATRDCAGHQCLEPLGDHVEQRVEGALQDTNKATAGGA